jgi:hypothetical protein
MEFTLPNYMAKRSQFLNHSVPRHQPLYEWFTDLIQSLAIIEMLNSESA